MKSRILTFITIIAVLAALTISAALSAQDQRQQTPRSYSVVTLGTLGGTASGGNSINAQGWVTGFSNQAGDQTQHAALWVRGSQFDLGTLGGPNSAVEWPVHNNHGRISGISETSAMDPLGEIWSCGFFFPNFTGHSCQGFVWEEGMMSALPTLGGNNSYGAGMNNRGQTVGWAETSLHDETCTPPQVLQFKGVLYGPRRDQVQVLPPLPGDPDSAATAINDNAQAVGISGLCSNAVGGLSAQHAVLWENGVPTDIGNLGGRSWNTPTAINNRGQVVGFSDLPDDEAAHPNFHAFLWTKEAGIQDLGTLPGDVRSEALGINDRGQVVGLSIDANHNLRAFLWENGVMTDLNSLVPAGSPVLLYANDINNRGQITGEAFDTATNQAPAYLATPTENSAFFASAIRTLGQTTVPETVQQQVQRRLGLAGAALAH
jgi:probable HAF family extracellular repeat protein